jgi:hypothetical protein
MAKRGRPRGVAAGIGKNLAKLVNKMERWRRQRDDIERDLRHVVESGQTMLAELGSRTGRTLTTASERIKPNRGGRRKGFKMSAEAKAKISAAAKKRWAARKRQQK